MALFVHLTSEKNVRSIVRTGIKAGKRGVFCLPALMAYSVSHQWLRELRRNGARTFVAVDFRVPDSEVVTVGHYNATPREMTAAEAIGVVRRQEDALGYEIVVRRSIARGELHRVRHVKQVTGWRYAPGENGKRPCGCGACVPAGAIKSADIRARYGDPPTPKKPELMAQLAAATDTFDICVALMSLATRSRGDAEALAYLLDHPDPEVRSCLAIALGAYRGRVAVDYLRRLLSDPDQEVSEDAAEALGQGETGLGASVGEGQIG
ncbi:HEAT repeat domain-containing protein [Actinokineospora sp. NBRC 105648]|uniref:HEAT repeat domain-containing protein n=1 Tax=Actinokineospora sp. NBRC 105648 TaxID=3032206 RepID=UPI0024A340FC|nr:HEAT repeat domain-containing protein [Actinokineospora sp. NBRC 105648]GLZ43641.1 hypothetical protein Acsp05_72650 [Actinokineospora sp. NBRC 105648]